MSAPLVHIALPAELRPMLERAQTAGPYKLSKTAVLKRGIELVIAELESLTPEKKP
jgi:hypothetical protein